MCQFSAVKENPGTLALRLAPPGQEAPQVSLRSDQRLRRADTGRPGFENNDQGREYEVELPPFTKESELSLYFRDTNR